MWDIIRIILIVVGIVLLLLAGLKKDFAQFNPGWLGATLIAIAVLIQVAVK